MAVDKRDLLRNLEGDYLLDYAHFTGAIRLYVTQSLEEHFVKDKNDLRRRMFLLAVFREEYSAYEDLGAMLDALLTHRRDSQVPLLERLISYGPGEVELSKVWKRFTITGSTELCDRLGLLDLVPADWKDEFPGLDLAKALRTAADFFFEECTRNQKKVGLSAFNKMKHGLLLVPRAKLYMVGQIDAPAALFKTDDSRPEAAANPFSLYAVPMTDQHLEARLRAIHFVQANLRMIAALWVIGKHPTVVTRRGVKKPIDILRTPYLADVVRFIEQLSRLRAGIQASNAG
ncbi:MAG: hypothetical protein ACRDFW_06695 [bacterium]